MSKPLVVYVAAPLNAPTEQGRQRNRENAALWVAWLAREFDIAWLAREFDIAPIADWVLLAAHWPETLRDRGLRVDLALVERADELWMVGPRVSTGMRLEGDYALRLGKPVRDLTGLGAAPEGDGDAVLRGTVAQVVGAL